MPWYFWAAIGFLTTTTFASPVIELLMLHPACCDSEKEQS